MTDSQRADAKDGFRPDAQLDEQYAAWSAGDPGAADEAFRIARYLLRELHAVREKARVSIEARILEVMAEAAAVEREECAKLCDSFAEERKTTAARIEAESRGPDDQRMSWVLCKQAEAERCAKAIRSRGRKT